MRSISIRQLQQHLHKELRDLPLQITIRGKPVYIITNVTTLTHVTTSNVTTYKDNVTTLPKPINTTHDAIQVIKTFPATRGICKHGAMKGLCKYGCM